jgi:ATP-binding cassette subfamily C (CFTR/MRP) protein 1
MRMATQLLTSVMTVFGTIALVFGIIFAPLGLLYYVQTTYYRRSMMETRRLDSLIRSGLYTTITGQWLRTL